jgi:hypothetical protein
MSGLPSNDGEFLIAFIGLAVVLALFIAFEFLDYEG